MWENLTFCGGVIIEENMTVEETHQTVYTITYSISSVIHIYQKVYPNQMVTKDFINGEVGNFDWKLSGLIDRSFPFQYTYGSSITLTTELAPLSSENIDYTKIIQLGGAYINKITNPVGQKAIIIPNQLGGSDVKGITNSLTDSVFVNKNEVAYIALAATANDNFELIGSRAFYNEANLKQVFVPGNGLTRIGASAFANSGLTSFNIKANLGNISATAFNNTQNLMNFTVSATNTKFKAVNGVLYSKDGEKLVHLPAGRTGTYKVKEGTKTIGENAIYLPNIDKLILPNSLKTINYSGIRIKDMEYLVIPASVTHIISRGIIDDDEYTPLDLKVYVNLTAAPATWEDMWAFDIDEIHYLPSWEYDANGDPVLKP
jgi:hypothetical protein